jgi:hypothetical protein
MMLADVTFGDVYPHWTAPYLIAHAGLPHIGVWCPRVLQRLVSFLLAAEPFWAVTGRFSAQGIFTFTAECATIYGGFCYSLW